MIRKTSSQRRHSYTKVLDVRKSPVRQLYRRNGSFYALISVEDKSRGQCRDRFVAGSI